MRLFLGQSDLTGDFSRYARRFQALEVDTDRGHLPKAARLRSWKSTAPAEFMFSCVLPRSVSSLDWNDRVRTDLERALEAAEVVGAAWLLLRTPPTVRPSARSRERLAALIERLGSARRKVAWEPSGLWEDTAALEVAAHLDVTLVRDLTRSEPPPGTELYTRIRSTGTGATLNAGRTQKLVERISRAEACTIIVEAGGAGRLRRLLDEELGFLGTSENDGIGAGAE